MKQPIYKCLIIRMNGKCSEDWKLWNWINKRLNEWILRKKFNMNELFITENLKTEFPYHSVHFSLSVFLVISFCRIDEEKFFHETNLTLLLSAKLLQIFSQLWCMMNSTTWHQAKSNVSFHLFSCCTLK